MRLPRFVVKARLPPNFSPGCILRRHRTRLSSLTTNDLEGFIRHLSKRMGRVGLQKPIAILRNFLRFLAADGTVPVGLDNMIDRPRIYRQEQLPRSLPWPTIQAFLGSINRDSAIGKRDFGMFSLMTTYGMRACDVVALTLDDIHWRAGLIRIRQSKTGKPLELPLTDEVGVRDSRLSEEGPSLWCLPASVPSSSRHLAAP